MDVKGKSYLFGEYAVTVAKAQPGDNARWFAVVYKQSAFHSSYTSRAPFEWWAAIIANIKARRSE